MVLNRLESFYIFELLTMDIPDMSLKSANQMLLVEAD